MVKHTVYNYFNLEKKVLEKQIQINKIHKENMTMYLKMKEPIHAVETITRSIHYGTKDSRQLYGLLSDIKRPTEDDYTAMENKLKEFKKILKDTEKISEQQIKNLPILKKHAERILKKLSNDKK